MLATRLVETRILRAFFRKGPTRLGPDLNVKPTTSLNSLNPKLATLSLNSNPLNLNPLHPKSPKSPKAPYKSPQPYELLSTPLYIYIYICVYIYNRERDPGLGHFRWRPVPAAQRRLEEGLAPEAQAKELRSFFWCFLGRFLAFRGFRVFGGLKAF